jgi:hypothetical protein
MNDLPFVRAYQTPVSVGSPLVRGSKKEIGRLDKSGNEISDFFEITELARLSCTADHKFRR